MRDSCNLCALPHCGLIKEIQSAALDWIGSFVLFSLNSLLKFSSIPGCTAAVVCHRSVEPSGILMKKSFIQANAALCMYSVTSDKK